MRAQRCSKARRALSCHCAPEEPERDIGCVTRFDDLMLVPPEDPS